MMLHKDLIIKGPPNNYVIPEGWQMGKHMIECIRKRDPNDIFCVDGITNEALTCSQFVNEILKIAHTLRTLGVKSGDVVSIVSENTMRYITTLLAIFYIGAIANLLNPGYSIGELKRTLNISQARLVFCSKTALKNVTIVKSESSYIEKIYLLESVPQNGENDVGSLDELLEMTSVDTNTVEPAKLVGIDHVALILLSSGTTGLPKCAMITHENCRTTAGCFGDSNYVGIGQGDSSIAVLPFFHILGSSIILSATLYSMKLVVLPSFQPEPFLRTLQSHKISLIYVVPAMVSFLAKHPIVRKFDLSSLKWILSSGGYLGGEIQEEFTKRYPQVSIRQLYGLTEMVGACAICASFDNNKVGSVGHIVPDTEGMVWDKELDENVGPFKTGELCFKGPSMMKGYLEREDNGVDKFGFYHTGDLGYTDEDGEFYIVGREKEILKYKGFQVSPVEIEDLIMKHAAVEDCGVVGVPDDRAGQLPTAVVVRQKNSNVTEKEIADFVAERISVHKHLHGGVKFTDSIPRNPAGKILRDKLFELYKSID